MRKQPHSFQGFTLIELLVVIAIIGILAAVILAALGVARGRGNDAAVKDQLKDFESQAAIIYNSQGCYGADDGTTNCAAYVRAACPSSFPSGGTTIFSNQTAYNIIAAAENNAGGTAGYSACVETAKGAAWAVSVQLNTGAWCVDSTGNVKAQTPTFTSQATFNAATVNTTGTCI
jgi:prepilin-type N-terminal cleavage/methylation domain-containing protein